MGHNHQNICLIGNPNSGKSTLFNALTGLQQKVSNFAGVTVDKKSGTMSVGDTNYNIIDLPGLYSLYPTSQDEKIVIDILTNEQHTSYPDLIVCVCDVTSLERQLLLACQLRDTRIPMIVVLNMMDIYEHKDQATLLIEEIGKLTQSRVLTLSSADHKGLSKLKTTIKEYLLEKPMHQVNQGYVDTLKKHHINWLTHLAIEEKDRLHQEITSSSFDSLKSQVDEIYKHYAEIEPVLSKLQSSSRKQKSKTLAIDNWVTHPLWGTILFLGIMLLVFQSIYSFSEFPMTMIEESFAWLSTQVTGLLPDTWWSSLITEGIIAGLGGVLVFIPQIALLFLFIAALEESGYMSRVVYMLDPIMRRFGLNGRSAVALISSGACAIPAIMSTRTIANWRERLTTIMVSPLISCSARIPVYAVLVGFVVPNTGWGPFRMQGMVFFGLYLLGIITALLAAPIISKTITSTEPSYLALELPMYKPPKWKNILFQVKNKVLTFITEAGKVIIIISIILWFLASYGPKQAVTQAVNDAEIMATSMALNSEQKDNLVASAKLEASYAGHLGKWIEPAIAPLGFDWKIGIALITSFAAREVFVGTMATIYSVGASSSEDTLRERMAKEQRRGSTIQMYSPATALSLLVFYVFALQCMSTLAVTKKETNSWKWPIIQFVFMGALAYIGSLITYQLMLHLS